MSEGINRVILLGNLGADPDLRFGQGGGGVLNMRLATTESYLDKDKQRKERTDWHTVVMFGKRAEGLGGFLKKGDTILVEGRIQTRSYEDRDGNKKYTTEVIANNVVPTGGGNRSADDRAPNTSRSPGRAGQRQADAPPGGGRGFGGGGSAPAPNPDNDGRGFGSDDDVPFASSDIAHDLRRVGL